ncbi:MAG: hypothetical protein P4L36_11965 [Holophaga sp.]|nr:hypothetical protein [Holophaga sp.]
MGGNWFSTGLDRLRGALLPSGQQGPIALAEALPWLMPKVQPRFQHEALALRTGRPGPEFRPLAGSFAVSLVVDLPDEELEVGAADLQRWNADFDRLMQKARSNLLARGGEEGFRRMGPGRYRSSWQDSLDGSRMLLPGVLQRLHLDGDPVVLLPNRDTLLVVGSEDPGSLGWALEGAMEFLDEDPRSLNGCPLRLRNYQWEPFAPEAGHPIRPLLARIQRRRLKDEYHRQKLLLDRRHGRLGKAITVAPFHLERTEGGQTSSFTVWSEAQGEAWLPEADRVRLDGGAGPAWLPWEALQRLSHLLEPVGLFPERYRLKSAPPSGLPA